MTSCVSPIFNGEGTALGNALGQRGGEGDNEERLLTDGRTLRGQTGEHVGAQNLTGCIAVAVLHRTTIGRGEKQYIALAEQLAEVVVKISGLFFIVGHHQEDFAGRLSYGTEHNGGS